MPTFTRRDLARILAKPDYAERNPDLSVACGDAPTPRQPDTAMVVEVGKTQVKRAAVEFALQASIIARVDLRANQDPVWKRVLAVPNGQYRRGQRMEPGTRKGVPDLQWPLRRGGYVGLVMELKAGDNDLTPEQREWLAWYEAQGWFVCVVYDDPDAAMETLEAYYNGAMQ